jgi:hypothetical protein
MDWTFPRRSGRPDQNDTPAAARREEHAAMDATKFDVWVRRLAKGENRRELLRKLAIAAPAAIAAIAATGVARPPTAVAAKTKCKANETKCKKRCCKKGQICANGKCVTGQGTCSAGADSCANVGNPLCRDASGQTTCLCLSRLEGGTRCGVYGNQSACDQCTTDADCIALGFPAGSSCTQDSGPDCPLCQNDNKGTCIIPCGLPDPT